MRSVVFQTFAKINLTLDVTGKRPDGYHELVTVMQSISISDTITVDVQDEPGIRLVCSAPIVPTDARNTAWRAAECFLKTAGVSDGLSIAIDKRIPITAGLAGGSSDAAGVLAALDWLYPDRLDQQQLLTLAAGIGADVPFCLTGGTVYCTGIGDILTPQAFLGEWPVLLIKAPFGLSTPDIFRRFDQSKVYSRTDHERFLKALPQADWPALAASAGNVLESVAFGMHPQLAGIKDQLLSSGALMAQMSGSGPTLFGMFSNHESRERAHRSLSGLTASGYTFHLADTVSTGIQFVSSYQEPELPKFLDLNMEKDGLSTDS